MAARRKSLLLFAGLSLLGVAVAVVLLAMQGGKGEHADLVLLNGKIITVDEDRPEARALAARGGILVAVGSDEDARNWIGPKTKVIDLEGKLAVPGFIEGHGHFLSLGYARMSLDLSDAKTWGEIVIRVKGAVEKALPGEWILGRGWHQEKWEKVPDPNVDGLPFHRALSAVSPDHPVFLTHASGHSAIANEKAMRLAGVTKETRDPPGGEIVRDESGRPIGVFRETAAGLLSEARKRSRADMTAEQRREERKRAARTAAQECLSKGVTTFHDAGVSFRTIDFFRELAKQGELGIRLWVMVSEGNAALASGLSDYRIVGEADHHLTVRAVKRLVDGALGSHGAWLLEPYADLPASTGLNTTSLATIRKTAEIAMDRGFQLCTHAIGDRGNREVLNVYEKAFRANPGKGDLRWRVEHAQHLHPADIPRFAKLGVIASMQGVHCTSDGPWVAKRIGEKRAASGAYAWRSLLKSGAVVCNGTDAPVEDVDPLANFHASVTRRLRDGTVFFAEQCMTREQALHSYTLACAYAAFEEELKGSLVVGKLADVTVLSRDILTVPAEEIPKTEVLYTIVGGKVLYGKED
ncbi:MAG: amidohydrolase [Planctomycetota bacterium]|jgi:predicted amidohydrolase YtcJ